MTWIAYKPLGSPSDATSTDYIGIAPKGETRAPDYSATDPQAYSAFFPRGWGPLRTHFHSVDQFQFVSRGSGLMTRHEVGFGSVHYADRHTPYGPIESGPDGLEFLTLRSISSAGAFYMPESRGLIAPALEDDPVGRSASDRRNVTFDLLTASEDGELTDFRCDSDGLRISALSIEPHAAAEVGPIGGDGAYLVVLSGSVEFEAEEFWRGSVHWGYAGESVKVAAGGDGVRLALLQLPVRMVS
jgi:mannose-6-phosphate isomerase-like protein (cupin superfamily)